MSDGYRSTAGPPYVGLTKQRVCRVVIAVLDAGVAASVVAMALSWYSVAPTSSVDPLVWAMAGLMAWSASHLADAALDWSVAPSARDVAEWLGDRGVRWRHGALAMALLAVQGNAVVAAYLGMAVSGVAAPDVAVAVLVVGLAGVASSYVAGAWFAWISSTIIVESMGSRPPHADR